MDTDAARRRKKIYQQKVKFILQTPKVSFQLFTTKFWMLRCKFEQKYRRGWRLCNERLMNETTGETDPIKTKVEYKIPLKMLYAT